MTTNNLTINNARVIFKNFKGIEARFNPIGKRNFCVLLETGLAETLAVDGWNIKWLPARNEEDDPQAYLQVSVSFDNYAPKIYMLSGGQKTLLDKDTVGELDTADVKSFDLIIRPYNWIINEGSKNEQRGVKAYLKTMRVVLEEDEFEDGY